MSIEIAATALAGAFYVLQTASCAIAAWRCRAPRSLTPPPPNAPRVTLVRTLCGVESHSVETLRSGFELDYPDFELLLCVALPSDPIIPVARRMIEAYPRVQARLLIGDERISANPKLNNMLKGWRAADGEWVVFADSNIILPRDYLQRVLSAWGPGVGLVSAPPIGDDPQNFWSEIECGLLNTHQARWQYVVDALGFGFGQGKTLMFRRDELAAIGFHKLADEPAEDAAATKAIRAAGKVVRLACPPFRQPLGLRTAEAVWSRHAARGRGRQADVGKVRQHKGRKGVGCEKLNVRVELARRFRQPFECPDDTVDLRFPGVCCDQDPDRPFHRSGRNIRLLAVDEGGVAPKLARVGVHSNLRPDMCDDRNQTQAASV